MRYTCWLLFLNQILSSHLQWLHPFHFLSFIVAWTSTFLTTTFSTDRLNLCWPLHVSTVACIDRYISITVTFLDDRYISSPLHLVDCCIYFDVTFPMLIQYCMCVTIFCGRHIFFHFWPSHFPLPLHPVSSYQHFNTKYSVPASEHGDQRVNG